MRVSSFAEIYPLAHKRQCECKLIPFIYAKIMSAGETSYLPGACSSDSQVLYSHRFILSFYQTPRSSISQTLTRRYLLDHMLFCPALLLTSFIYDCSHNSIKEETRNHTPGSGFGKSLTELNTLHSVEFLLLLHLLASGHFFGSTNINLLKFLRVFSFFPFFETSSLDSLS